MPQRDGEEDEKRKRAGDLYYPTAARRRNLRGGWETSIRGTITAARDLPPYCLARPVLVILAVIGIGAAAG